MKRIFCYLLLMLPLLLNSCGGNKSLDYFPMNTGNTWIYEAEMDGASTLFKWEVKILKKEKVGEFECFVMESYSEGSEESLVKEYYTRTKEGIAALKESYPDGEVKFNPPVLRLKVPLEVGLQWEWKGKIIGRQADYSYKVEKKEKIKTAGQEFDCFKVVLRGRDDSGEVLESSRWLAPGIGMVKEESSLLTGTKERKMTATLQSYQIGGKSNLK